MLEGWANYWARVEGRGGVCQRDRDSGVLPDDGAVSSEGEYLGDRDFFGELKRGGAEARECGRLRG